jgi:hypothetical protein
MTQSPFLPNYPTPRVVVQSTIDRNTKEESFVVVLVRRDCLHVLDGRDDLCSALQLALGYAEANGFILNQRLVRSSFDERDHHHRVRRRVRR